LWLARLRRLAQVGSELRGLDTAAASSRLTRLLDAIVGLTDAVAQPLAHLDAA
jgi:hypothetical protein